jgi:hypothetical protein
MCLKTKAKQKASDQEGRLFGDLKDIVRSERSMENSKILMYCGEGRNQKLKQNFFEKR